MSIKLILHIGAGKTGSTSIQSTLKANKMILKEKGIWYLGMMLENADSIMYDWQEQSGIRKFHALYEKSEKELNDQVLTVMHSIIDSAKTQNIHTLIWSHEAFFNHNMKLRSALKDLEKNGIEIEIVAYIRNFSSWIKSAYIQWGIKHKAYPGRIMPFNKWIANGTYGFYGQLKNTMEAFPGQVKIRNMDATGDVVRDFSKLCGIDPDEMVQIRSNESLKNEELFLRALFNNQFDSDVLPSVFEKIVDTDKLPSDIPSEYLRQLLPSEESIQKFTKNKAKEIELLNTLLVDQGQEVLKEGSVSGKSTAVNSEILLFKLSKIVMDQAVRIDKLEKEIKNIKT